MLSTTRRNLVVDLVIAVAVALVIVGMYLMFMADGPECHVRGCQMTGAHKVWVCDEHEEVRQR
jgi:hypothetical protein